MPLGKSLAVVLGSFPLGESDRVVTFFSRDFGRVRGVAKAARRLKSRFAGALELGTLGELVFFDTGRSDLLRIDHFDIVRPFRRVREDLESLGHAAWMLECVARLTAERDPNAALYGLLVRALRSAEAGGRPARVALVFGLRCIDILGHRLRIDACVECGAKPSAVPVVAMDVEAGGILCAACGRGRAGILPASRETVGALRGLRGSAWDEALGSRLGRVEAGLRDVVDAQVTRLAGGQPPRASRFLREVRRLTPAAGGRP